MRQRKNKSRRGKNSKNSKSSRESRSKGSNSGPKVLGKLQLHQDGYGFVLQAEKGKPDIFIPPPATLNAMDGDEVEAEILRAKGDKKFEGRIVRVLRRSKNILVGSFEMISGKPFLFCQDNRKSLRMLLNPAHTDGIEEGQTLIGRITEYPSETHKDFKGEVLRVLGKRGEPATEVEVTIAKHNIAVGFTEETLKEAAALGGEVNEKDYAGRQDLRNLPIVTIDGENARDFDDAVFVKKVKNGYKLYVAIADVSHYVKPGSSIDEDAYMRATSTYFPNRCIPMLPEALSNELCSLKPKVDRLCFVAEMDFNSQGQRTSSKFYKGIIRSAARLTYTLVKKMLVDLDVELRLEHKNIVPHLDEAFQLFKRLRAMRIERGSIDFDLPEPEIILDVEEGVATAILKTPRTEAHMLIEEFMIAANEAVAEFLEESGKPSVYRIHETPDPEKMADFKALAYHFSYSLPTIELITPKQLAEVVKLAKGKPEERLINTVLLRSLKQAIYSIENLGHFGLASECYTHFTSPIRRYPDLIVHRLLEAAIDKSSKKNEEDQAEILAEMAQHCSQMERKSMQAEWEIRDLYVALFMRDKIGEEYEGIISSVTRFGVFVELKPYFVEGLVHLTNLKSESWEFDDKRHELRGRQSGTLFKIGDPIKVLVAKVDIERRQIDFTIVSEPPQA